MQATELRNYIAGKVGDDFLKPFELWAFGGKIKTVDSATLKCSWNLMHGNQQITKDLNTYDAVDRMIAIWKERFE